MAKICYTKDGNKKSLLSLTEKITTPSIHIQKDGNHWYVPLFSGNNGSVIQNGDYNYTLGEFKVGSYRAAISREVANHRPGIQILSYPSGITDGVIGEENSLRFTVTDIDNDLLTVKIYCTQNNPTPSSEHNFYETAIKTYENVSSGTISFSGYVPESGANGYSNMGDYVLRVEVTDSKGASVSSDYINIHKNANLFESTVFWVDFGTRYIGTYSDNGSTITITNTTGRNGKPYQQFCGFDPKLIGKSLTWDIVSNGSSIKSRWTQNCSYVYDNPVIVNYIEGNNIDGTTPKNHYGVKICEGWVPNGKYDLIFTVIDGDETYKYYLHIIMNVPDNPSGSL